MRPLNRLNDLGLLDTVEEGVARVTTRATADWIVVNNLNLESISVSYLLTKSVKNKCMIFIERKVGTHVF